MSNQPKPLHPKIAAALSATKATYRRLGSSGLMVSVPILGCMSYGDKKWVPWLLEEEESLPVIKAAYDKGITTWDTADIYSMGVSERIVGKALKKYSIPRDRVVIMTKCFNLIDEEEMSVNTGPGPNPAKTETAEYVNRSGLSRNHIFNAVDASLKRLDIDYIDVLQIHRFDYNTPIEETMLALHDLVRSGKVRYIGASSMWTYKFVQMQTCAEKNGWTKFISMQNHYSLLYREEEREMNRYCTETGVGLIPWGPLAAGMLARPFKDLKSTERGSGQSDDNPMMNEQIIKRVEEIAEKKGWKMSQVALAWINKRVTSPIVGFSSVERLDEAVARKNDVLTEEEEKYLMEPYKTMEIRGHF